MNFYQRLVWVEDIEQLKNETPIGTFVKFHKYYPIDRQTDSDNEEIKRDKNTIISGVITAKYPHLFMLDDGSTYPWKQYAVCCVK